MSFSDRLQALRRQRGMTQERFAEVIGYSGRTIQAWENGGVLPPVKVIVRIADYFSTSTDYLLCRTDYPVFVRRNEIGEPWDGEGEIHAAAPSGEQRELSPEEIAQVRVILAEHQEREWRLGDKGTAG